MTDPTPAPTPAPSAGTGTGSQATLLAAGTALVSYGVVELNAAANATQTLLGLAAVGIGAVLMWVRQYVKA